MADVFDIADFFVSVLGKDIEHTKLHKLLYYAQAHSLALTGKALFDNDIYAWEDGPVVPEIYHNYHNK